MIELRQLRYLIATADAGSFSRAARRLNIKQATLSRHIMSIERLIKKQIPTKSHEGAGLIEGAVSSRGRGGREGAARRMQQLRRAGWLLLLLSLWLAAHPAGGAPASLGVTAWAVGLVSAKDAAALLARHSF